MKEHFLEDEIELVMGVGAACVEQNKDFSVSSVWDGEFLWDFWVEKWHGLTWLI